MGATIPHGVDVVGRGTWVWAHLSKVATVRNAAAGEKRPQRGFHRVRTSPWPRTVARTSLEVTSGVDEADLDLDKQADRARAKTRQRPRARIAYEYRDVVLLPALELWNPHVNGGEGVGQRRSPKSGPNGQGMPCAQDVRTPDSQSDEETDTHGVDTSLEASCSSILQSRRVVRDVGRVVGTYVPRYGSADATSPVTGAPVSDIRWTA